MLWQWCYDAGMDILGFLRQFKIGPFSIFDFALAYIGVFFIAPLLTRLFFRLHLKISRSSWLWLTLPISVLFHAAFQQNTPLMKMLLNPHGFYAEKLVILFMLFMGLRKIRLVKATKQ